MYFGTTLATFTMITSSNGNIFRITGALCGEFTGESSSQRPVKALMFTLICVWTKDWVQNRDAGDLRRHRAHYDVKVMTIEYAQQTCTDSARYISLNVQQWRYMQVIVGLNYGLVILDTKPLPGWSSAMTACTEYRCQQVSLRLDAIV